MEHIEIPEGFRHYNTTVFAETDEAYEGIDAPETSSEDGKGILHVWKVVKIPQGLLTVFPPIKHT